MNDPKAASLAEENCSVPSNLGILKPLMVWLAAAFFYLYEYIIRVAPSVAEEEMQSDFGVGAGLLGAALATFYYVYAPMQLVAGMLYDRWGGRKLLLPASLLATAGCFLLYWANDAYWMLVIARFLMGLGSGFAFVGVIYLSTVWFGENRLAMLSGAAVSLGMFGAILGESALARVVDVIGWRDGYFWLGLLGIFSVLLVFFFVPKVPAWERVRRAKIARKHADENFVYGLKRVVSNPQTWVIGIVGSSMFLPLIVFGDLWGVQYVMKVAQVSKAEAADACSLMYLGWAIGGPISGWVSDHIGRRKKPMLISMMFGGILMWSLLIMPGLSITWISILLFLVGLTSSVHVVIYVASVETNPSFARGTAVGIINTIVMIAGGLMQALVGQLLDMQREGHLVLGPLGTSTYNTEYAASDYRYALMAMPFLIGLGFILCLFMKETYEPESYNAVLED